jgi:hypothetical protein
MNVGDEKPAGSSGVGGQGSPKLKIGHWRGAGGGHGRFVT